MLYIKNKIPLSVFIIAKNEEDRLPEAISSVKEWVDEVIVIDSGSDDRTVQVALNLGARVYYNQWEGYGKQKVFGENKCKQKWILNIDADEEVNNILKDEIITLFQEQNLKKSAYKIKIKILPRFSKKVMPFAPGHTQVRLYNKDFCGFSVSPVHDAVIVQKGKIGRLKGCCIHRSFRSHSHSIKKLDFYSSMQAKELFKKNKIPSKIRIVIEPFFAFLKAYILKRYMLWGNYGIVQSYIYAFGRLMRLAKTRELFLKFKKP